MYTYRATLDRVIDGDTVDLIVDLGFNVRLKERFRLDGIDAPESRTRDLEEKARGKAATQFLWDKIMKHPYMRIDTNKDRKGKYGRYLATLFVGDSPDQDSTWYNLNALLVIEGHAIWREY